MIDTAKKQTMKMKAECFLSLKIRFFYHESFDKREFLKHIIADMPDYEKFIAKKQKMSMDHTKNKISIELLPCYDSPLLSKEQEAHLFRKMNFYKYKAQSLINTIDLNKLNSKKLKTIQMYLELARENRDMIAKCNFRLAIHLIKKYVFLFRGIESDDVLADAYRDIVKCVDYFNWTLGNRFSTYTIWTMRKNFYGKIKESQESLEKTYHFDRSSLELIARDESGYETEKRHFENQQVVRSLIDIMYNDTAINEKARIRLVKIVELYFGVNGQQKKGLTEIGKELGVSKERIRQLRDRAIQFMQRKAIENGVKIEY
jgi:RNA polymerase sigma factor (sigma-70 family)